ncbi:MAG: hypothetical protein N2053_02090 [Chitinispirillaceae bacterium]|nr:hypothetical protein [Chitinispirillaceae bacterium]
MRQNSEWFLMISIFCFHTFSVLHKISLTSYIDLPLLFKIILPLSEYVKPDAYVGPALCFRIGNAKYSASYYYDEDIG